MRFSPLFLLSLAAALPVFAQGNSGDFDLNAKLDACNLDWDVPGPTSAESMPVGNGDIGLNVWTETNGDVVFYIGKTDAWGDNVRADQDGLMKVGAVRVSLNPPALVPGAPFHQVLRLRTGDIQIQEGATTLKVWVDANHPVIRVEAEGSQPFSMSASLNNWRPVGAEDAVMDQTGSLAWYHRDSPTARHVANLTFGAVVKGAGWTNQDSSTLVSANASTHQMVSIYPLTATTASADEWLARVNAQMAAIEQQPLAESRAAHEQWWGQFWQRSWVFVTGDASADQTTRGYVWQRFVTACGGRGAYPIKFNGSIFVVDNPALAQGRGKPSKAVTPDYRMWGGGYWFQNTRCMYWPRLAAGDFDLMMPLFKMYFGMLSNNAAQVRGFYKHGGAHFAEVSPFWGGVSYSGADIRPGYHSQYFTPILELSMMMLDYYEYTGDQDFARQMLVPTATAGLQFFNEHFARDAQGKLLLDPDNAIEQFWSVHDPAPDIAGLKAVIPRMMALPDDLVDASTRAGWKKLLTEVPDLPVGERNGKKVLLPYTGDQTAPPRNGENPELYAVYPFRLYGLGKPDFQLAADSFVERICKEKGCWVQDPVEAAMLGFADTAREYVTYNFKRSDPRLKFPAFWIAGNDYVPDEDNGGNGENGLQQMLMYTDGRKIMLLPAWPKGWNADFKLNAPFKTTVQAKVRDGKIADLVVVPAERKADIIDMSAGR